MNHHPTLGDMVAKAIVETPVFNLPLEIEHKTHEIEMLVGDFMRARTEPASWAVLAKEEPRLLSTLAGLQFICSLLETERQKKAREL